MVTAYRTTGNPRKVYTSPVVYEQSVIYDKAFEFKTDVFVYGRFYRVTRQAAMPLGKRVNATFITCWAVNQFGNRHPPDDVNTAHVLGQAIGSWSVHLQSLMR